jgi:diguanylate cyclase (GGDEF)-like protein
MSTFATAQAGDRSRRSAGLVAIALVLLVIVSLPAARIRLPELAPFLSIYTTLAWIGEIITAYLLFTQARLSQQAPLAILAAGYLYNAALIVPHLLTFPQVFASAGLLGGHAQSAVWLWALWHGGFPIWVLAYVIAERTISPARRAAWSSVPAIVLVTAIAFAAALAGTLLATIAIPHLPQLVVHGDYSYGFRSGVFEAVLGLNAAAFVATAFGLRNKTVTQTWLVVAVLVACCDASLTLYATYRFSVGWYLARCYSVVAASTIFVVFLSEVNVLYGRLAQLVTIDGLTGVGNRRLFEDRFAIASRDAARNAKPLSLIMLDVDEFKAYNDACGHIAGDEALRTVAQLARASVARPVDTIARYGGEEFVIVLPNTTAQGAAVVAERIRASIEAAAIPHPGSTRSPVLSASLGIATAAPPHPSGSATLVERADAALYRAKAGGRNRIEIAEPA